MNGRCAPFRVWLLVILLLALVGLGACVRVTTRTQPEEASLAPYVVTSQEIVDEMLRLAGVGKDDVIFDLGSGMGGSSSPLPGSMGQGASVSS